MYVLGAYAVIALLISLAGYVGYETIKTVGYQEAVIEVQEELETARAEDKAALEEMRYDYDEFLADEEELREREEAELDKELKRLSEVSDECIEAEGWLDCPLPWEK